MDQTVETTPQIPATPPKNWLVESILVTIFCCLPFGIAGIVFAAQVNGKFAQGDYAGAVKSSQDAAKWTKLGFFIGLGLLILYAVFLFAFGGWALMQNRNDY